jgi:glutamine synthetase
MSDMAEHILEEVRKHSVRFVIMQFMDILGNIKNVTIPAAKLYKAIDDGVVFDGSSIVGYATIEESDMRAYPDVRTFRILPWTENTAKTAIMICDICDAKENRFSGDPRYVLQRTLDLAKEKGWVLNAGPEYEFFLFKLDGNGKPTTIPADSGRYFDLLPMDSGEEVTRKTALHLDQLSFDVEAFHHEAAPGQHEIDLRYADALTSADRVLTLKYALRTVALEHGLYATFMPKPLPGINGSGMHVHQSLADSSGKDVFYNETGKWQLSDVCRWYIGGVLKYARETCAILASWTNSYKRLVPGYEAPVYISWANMNRSALIRVPAGRKNRTRIEVRNPDPSGNPYLQYSVMLAAGLRGIEYKIEPPEPVETDIYRLSTKDRQRLSVGTLPENLSEALDEMEESELMRDTLGAHIFTHFLYMKRKEWDEYRTQVTEWEVKNFLPVL